VPNVKVKGYMISFENDCSDLHTEKDTHNRPITLH